MPDNSLRRFFLKVFLWLPACFFIWYTFAPTLVWPVANLTDVLLTELRPDLFESIEQRADRLETVIRITPSLPPEMTDQYRGTAVITFDINPLVYGYGLPLFLALLLASPGGEGEKWRRGIAGTLILFLVQTWGGCFEIVKILLFDLGPDISGQVSETSWHFDAVALGYQFGTLILPSVTPVVLWIAFHRRFLSTLILYGPRIESQSMLPHDSKN